MSCCHHQCGCICPRCGRCTCRRRCCASSTPVTPVPLPVIEHIPTPLPELCQENPCPCQCERSHSCGCAHPHPHMVVTQVPGCISGGETTSGQTCTSLDSMISTMHCEGVVSPSSYWPHFCHH